LVLAQTVFTFATWVRKTLTETYFACIVLMRESCHVKSNLERTAEVEIHAYAIIVC